MPRGRRFDGGGALDAAVELRSLVPEPALLLDLLVGAAEEGVAEVRVADVAEALQ